MTIESKQYNNNIYERVTKFIIKNNIKQKLPLFRVLLYALSMT